MLSTSKHEVSTQPARSKHTIAADDTSSTAAQGAGTEHARHSHRMAANTSHANQPSPGAGYSGGALGARTTASACESG